MEEGRDTGRKGGREANNEQKHTINQNCIIGKNLLFRIIIIIY